VNFITTTINIKPKSMKPEPNRRFKLLS
jgi:hypothetical protein